MVLVEKVSRSAVVRRDDIVFFTPPPVLREVVASAGGTLNPSDLFVKRVAGLPGDTVTVNADGGVDVRPPPPPSRGGGGWLPQGVGRGEGRRGEWNAETTSRERPAGIIGTEGSQGDSGGGVVVAQASGASGGGERGPAKAAALPDSVLQRIIRVDEKVLDGAFVLGDNPAASMDSRVWGQLDEGEIVGHALLRVLPPRSFGLLR